MFRSEIQKILASLARTLFGIETVPEFSLEISENSLHGDYAANIALILAKKIGKNPREIADTLKKELELAEELEKKVVKIEVAGAGFLNFFLHRAVLSENLRKIADEGDNFGKNILFSGKKVMVEYTDPNPFKEFHIGHLMPNIIGESIARLFQYSGAEVKRANYQGDIGLHVAKAVWAFLHEEKKPSEDNKDYWVTLALGEYYTKGHFAYENDPHARAEIREINKKIYERTDPEINEIYDKGKAQSLIFFDEIYKKLGTHFDFLFFESEVSMTGEKAVEEGLQKNIFEASEGAVVFRGVQYGLHTRVFINSEGLPTYEAKELGLSKIKYEKFPYDLSYIVTGNEIVDYFKVLLKAMELLYPDLAKNTRHVPHGMLRLPEGKMSSRTGNVLAFRTLLNNVCAELLNRVPELRNNSGLLEKVAIGAIKYSILRQAIGRDIVFDFKISLSFEGESGPYVQYAYARARSVVRKAEEKAIRGSLENPSQIEEIERMLLWFPDVVARAAETHEPHHVVTYVSRLAQTFNSFYAREKIIDSEYAAYRVFLTAGVATVLKNGMWLLGIDSPEKM